MPTDAVTAFLGALGPAHRQWVLGQPEGRQEELAAAWRAELRDDTDLDTYSELSPPAAADEAARRVVEAAGADRE
ncbi:hypothetical protein [Streptomyces sp. ISL-11]|uniref:hypothetical protein n=1 Tax=Streptomyces sp. ISL-11 TaxID=2819174 RepID=UPI001BE98458|nr:hypothetical protein [Streptomyces sp. ISL-11]MBT2386506.1 hypothetical protein [Streptomyces sp. ISL-11]